MAKNVTKKELLETAKGLGLKGVQPLNKVDLTHSIQVAEGNNPCFQNIYDCWVNPCRFRAECQG